jgi:hypothetical protein
MRSLVSSGVLLLLALPGSPARADTPVLELAVVRSDDDRVQLGFSFFSKGYLWADCDLKIERYDVSDCGAHGDDCDADALTVVQDGPLGFSEVSCGCRLAWGVTAPTEDATGRDCDETETGSWRRRAVLVPRPHRFSVARHRGEQVALDDLRREVTVELAPLPLRPTCPRRRSAAARPSRSPRPRPPGPAGMA